MRVRLVQTRAKSTQIRRPVAAAYGWVSLTLVNIRGVPPSTDVGSWDNRAGHTRATRLARNVALQPRLLAWPSEHTAMDRRLADCVSHEVRLAATS